MVAININCQIFEINRKAEEKADQIFLRIKDLYYTDVLKKY